MSEKIAFKKYQIRSADYHWQQISRNIFKFNAYVAARYQQVVKVIPPTSEQKILDIGCGDGVLCWLIYKKTKANVVGIDTNSHSLKAARTKLKARNVPASFKQASAYKLPFKADSFDLVIAADIIEHLTKPQQMLEEIKRVLKPKGQAIITTPVKLSAVPKDKMHVQEFTSKELKQILSHYFKEVTIRASHPVWFKKLYVFTIFKIGDYYLNLFRWLINILALFTGYNPFNSQLGRSSQQMAICQKT